MSRILFALAVLINTGVQAQVEFNPSLFNLTYNDEFNGTRNPEWTNLEAQQPWGTQLFSSDPKYISYATEGSRTYLNLNAYEEAAGNGYQIYSGGISISDWFWNGSASVPNPNNNFYYGYYEIEAKLDIGANPLNQNGIWPAFWLSHGGSTNGGAPYWYEEVDIFEPGPCQVKDNNDLCHYWTLNDPNFLNDPATNNNIWVGEGFEGTKIVDMFNWHRYGLLWLPDRLVFYYDGIAFHTCTLRVPSHDKPHLFIDLQTDHFCNSPTHSANHFLGSFKVNYFRYYTPKTCSASIDAVTGNGYNFSTWVNSITNVKEYCNFSNTSIPASGTVEIYSSDVSIPLNFSVPVGSTFQITPDFCD